MKKIAEVAVPVSLSLDETFDYAIPAQAQEGLRTGCRVLVPFGKKRLIGYVTSFKDTSPYENRLKPILKVLDPQTPMLDDRLTGLARYLRETYYCSLAQAFDTVLPQSVRKSSSAKQESSFSTDFSMRLSQQEEDVVKGSAAKNIIILEDPTGQKRWDFYRAWIKQTLSQGKSVLFLVPEFSRIPQARENLGSGLPVCVITSRDRASVVKEAWNRARQAQRLLVIGTRSAIFAPLRDIGTIIVDEESHFAYRQQQVPNYHARDLALKIAKEERARLILCGFAPSLEAFDLSGGPDAAMLRIAGEHPDLQSACVDMRQEYAPKGRAKIISKVLGFRLNEIMERRESCLLFVDQKAFSTFMYCPKCKKPLHCNRCSSPLAFYRSTRSYICPACHLKQEAGDICPKCSSAYIRYAGFGEEKVESELLRLFPAARIARFPGPAGGADGAGAKDGTGERGYDIMLAGPQILEKSGFEQKSFRLVAVINADHTLGRSDFRATEMAYAKFLRLSLLSSKEFLVQTHVPDHYVWDFLRKQDTRGFLERELEERRALGWPPALWLGALTIRARTESLAQTSACQAIQSLKRQAARAKTGIEIFDLQEARPFRLRGYYRYQILMKYRDLGPLKKTLSRVIHQSRGTIATFDPALY
ncbi:MAG: primosomal protein N' [Candidatus Omnitrophota bacterium]